MSSIGMDAMEQRSRWPLLRLLVLILIVSVLVLVAFGAGIGIGLRVRGGGLPSLGLLPAQTSVPSPQATTTAVGGVQTPVGSPTACPPSLTSQPGEASSGQDLLDLALFEEVWDLLKKQFYGELPEGKEITYNAIRGVVDRLGDRHTAFVDPQHAALLKADIEGHFEGIGARVDLAEGGGVQITYLFAGQPAERAGLRVGDVIIAVDGKDVTKLGLTEAITLIRGPKGSHVVLLVRRGDQAPIEIEVVRDRIEIPVVDAKVLADGRIAYIALAEFSNVAPARLADAVREALSGDPAGIILDLRGNPGGLLDAAVRIGSYFVPEGNILIERSKEGRERIYKREGPYLLGKTRLVVLVDGGSASASEIVAGAIQDAGTGILVGERTYGKGSVQLPNTLSDGSQLRVTIARWFTPKGRAIHEVGLEPDITVPVTAQDIEAKRDPQLERAVDYLLQ